MSYRSEKMSGDSERCSENSYTAKSAVAKANKSGPRAAPKAGSCNLWKHFSSNSLVPFDTKLSLWRRWAHSTTLPSHCRSLKLHRARGLIEHPSRSKLFPRYIEDDTLYHFQTRPYRSLSCCKVRLGQQFRSYRKIYNIIRPSAWVLFMPTSKCLVMISPSELLQASSTKSPSIAALEIAISQFFPSQVCPLSYCLKILTPHP